MDYKYIEQLIDKYFEGETSLEEEKILRAFFCQNNVPEDLLPYREFFVYAQYESTMDTLGKDFDEKILAMVGEGRKEKEVSLLHKVAIALHPLFKAAAIVAIIVTIGNASQAMFENLNTSTSVATIKTHNGNNVADILKDSIKVDSLQPKNN